MLIAHKLNTAEYLRVIGKPVHLIVSLYEHPSINQRIQNSCGKDYPGEGKTLFVSFHPRRITLLIPWYLALKTWGSFFNSFFLFFFKFFILDIHTAAKEIAEVNEINLEKVWDMLLEKWLCPSAKPDEVSACLDGVCC